MLVMSLEEYDEVTGTAAKAAIMTKDVVGQDPARHARSAAPRRGCSSRSTSKGAVDLAFIATLYGKPTRPSVIAELGDLIYHDPETEDLADGRRLPLGERPGEARRGRAARAGVRPERRGACGPCSPRTCCPATSTPTSGPRGFPRATSRRSPPSSSACRPSSIPVGHLKKDAVWSVEAGYAARAVGRRDDRLRHGAGQRHLAPGAGPEHEDPRHLRHRQPRRPRGAGRQPGGDARRPREAEAHQGALPRPGSSPTRSGPSGSCGSTTTPTTTSGLRLFDGSHLDFPGMNQTITLRPHQKDAVWRGMSGGNTLLAHVVGAGKTFTMAATGMKMKQAGLIQKPLYVVPEPHAGAVRPRVPAALPERQAARRHQGGPGPRPAEAPHREDRQRRVGRHHRHAQLASSGSACRGSTRSSSSASRSPSTTSSWCDSAKDSTRAHRNIIKTIEKQKASREERLKDLLAEDKKDDGLVFDELGVDHLFIDEAHYFKNLETPTKMERVAGIQTGGSERAFDLYMKARYLRRAAPRPRRHVRHRHADQQHDGRDVHDAAVPRPGGPAEPRHRALRRLGGDLRRGGGHDGDLPGRGDACGPGAASRGS